MTPPSKRENVVNLTLVTKFRTDDQDQAELDTWAEETAWNRRAERYRGLYEEMHRKYLREVLFSIAALVWGAIGWGILAARWWR